MTDLAEAAGELSTSDRQRLVGRARGCVLIHSPVAAMGREAQHDDQCDDQQPGGNYQ